MKALLISLLLITSVKTFAQVETIRYDGAGAPITAKLQLMGVSRNMTTINAKFHSILSGSITFNEKTLTLILNRAMPRCAQGMMCIQVMPTPFYTQLDVVQVEKTKCSVKYTAKTDLNATHNLVEEVVVEDFSDSVCPRILGSAGNVTYKVTGVSTLTKQTETATATFNVDGNFIRAQN